VRVEAEIDYDEVENENGHLVDVTTAACSRCDHTTESYGSSERSVRRCLALLREECPEGENNFYGS
jgi:hypothetical protein